MDFNQIESEITIGNLKEEVKRLQAELSRFNLDPHFGVLDMKQGIDQKGLINKEVMHTVIAFDINNTNAMNQVLGNENVDALVRELFDARKKTDLAYRTNSDEIVVVLPEYDAPGFLCNLENRARSISEREEFVFGFIHRAQQFDPNQEDLYQVTKRALKSVKSSKTAIPGYFGNDYYRMAA